MALSSVGDDASEFMNQKRKEPVCPRLTPRSIAAAVLIAGFAASLALNLPGQLSYDSIAQLHDGRVGIYSSWHPPVMAWLLGLFDTIVPGTSLFVVFDAAVLFASMLSLLWLAPKPSWPALVTASICVLLPQFLLYQGIVWKDVLFADSAIAGFICIAHAGASWPRVRRRNTLLCGGIVLLVLASLARQNGAVTLVFGIAAIGVLTALQAPTAKFRTTLAYVVTGSLGASCLWFAASLALATRAPGESGPMAQLKLLETYDITGAVKQDPGLRLPRIDRANPDLEQSIRTEGVRLYTPQRNDTLATATDLQSDLSDTPQSVISAEWIGLILQHPWLYLKVRARVFAWTLFTPDISRCVPYFVGVEGLPRFMRDLRVAARVRPQDAVLKSYGALFVGTPALSHVTYALMALASVPLLLRRGGSADVALAFLLASALAFTMTFFVISIACDYRYLVFLDLSALVGAFHLAASRHETA